MIGVVTDLELVLDELSDAAAGPDLPAKAKGFGTLKQHSDKLCVLRSTQQGLRTGRGMVTQSCDPIQGGPLEPLADRALGDAQGLRDLSLRPSLLVQVPGPQAATFLPTSRRVAICCAHRLRVQQIPAHEY